MNEPTGQEVEPLAKLFGDGEATNYTRLKARFVLESDGPQAMADRRAAEVLDATMRQIEATICDHLDGSDECERLLFSVELVANGKTAELRWETE